ncbi:MAG TPA: hypothetical protein PKO06_23615, partial [Candidatus Ozemobacteraceae bacterium]|nr:hypothetical protein [Candidatus Ozemobacteraceae bacterium]
RAWTFLKKQETEQSLREFRQLQTTFPGDPAVLGGLREAERLQLNGALQEAPTAEHLPGLREQGRFFEALQLSDALLAQNSDQRLVLSERAKALMALARWKEAEECFAMLLQKEAAPEYRRERMMALWSLGRLQEAAVEAREIVQTEPNHVLAIKIVADDLYTVGRFEQSLTWYQKLPEDLWAWLGQGWCHLVMGKKELARPLFQKCLMAYPGHTSAIEGLRRSEELATGTNTGH